MRDVRSRARLALPDRQYVLAHVERGTCGSDCAIEANTGDSALPSFAEGGREGETVNVREAVCDPSAPLAILANMLEAVQKTRRAMLNRAAAADKAALPEVAALARTIAGMEQSRWVKKKAAAKATPGKRKQAVRRQALDAYETQINYRLKRALMRHPVWPWLKQFPGLSGPMTARLLAIMGNPHRFPGQTCSMGHIQPPVYSPGAPCPVQSHEGEPCPGVMLAPRTGTGVRSWWHYLGQHAVDGRAPRRQKGQRADWHTKGKTLILQPDGLADQIIKHRTPVYRDRYDEVRARLEGDEQDVSGEGFVPKGRAHDIARKVAGKAFLGDLLTECKRVIPLRA